MKFYKIVDPKGHNGLVYHEGLNIDPLPFNPSSNCTGGGIYFAREDILAFLGFGTDLYEVEPVGDEVYENPSVNGEPKKWKAKQLNMKYIGKVWDNIQFLVEQGANTKHLSVGLNYAAKNGDLELIKRLIKHGVDIHDCNDFALGWAAMNGQLDVVKYFLESGCDIHAENDSALCWAAGGGELDVVKYLVEQGANVHINDGFILRWAAFCGKLDVVKYLVEQIGDIHNYIESALERAKEQHQTEVFEYLETLK